jgi:hypothetical protein
MQTAATFGAFCDLELHEGLLALPTLPWDIDERDVGWDLTAGQVKTREVPLTPFTRVGVYFWRFM